MHEDGSTSGDRPSGISRREALKRGAVVGGTALWVTPVLHVLSITEAAAQQPSGQQTEVGRGKAKGQG